ncbi:MAG: DEAD/DEAH box helicase family protein, partial [Anaerolineae bacterium]|nr:DEAD/DEAH box helicase family protein [Anaerolineae bacterium]NIN99844.1 DEAD/DEAH box helicase family protein [Anaerolineae bacterium]NIQ82619.1 DEAD/DEAH box helicase family protein [Anaerolineae bacterium]
LADGVGLGKTIQAGLVLTELMARRLAHRVLVVSPAGLLLEQWKTEMLERFGLRLDVVDRARLEEIRRQSELGDNPFDHIPLGLASIDFLKQERILAQLERTSYDVVVIDEAHHCTDPGRAAEWEDSQRRRLAMLLASRCDSLLLLTATPHDGYDRSFASLLELLDPSLVDADGGIRGTRYRANVIRRLKPHIKDPETGKCKFKERIVEPCPVLASESKHSHFVEFQRHLLELVAPELRRALRSRRYSDVLAFITLLKRSVSTVSACRSTLSAVTDRLGRILSKQAEAEDSRRQRLRSLREYQRRLQRFGALSPEEEEERALLEAEDIAQQLASLQREIRSGSRRFARLASVTEALDELGELAIGAEDEDPKLKQLA